MNTKKFFKRTLSADYADERRFVFSTILSAKICEICGRFSVGEIEIRAAHEIMAARATQLALLIDQLMPALQAITPMLAGNIPAV
jgi:hypothetical protein